MLHFGHISKKRLGFVSTVALVATLMSGAVSAQGLRDARPPAEFPPASFTGNQYVDSRGCVFVRAGISGATEWVPRVSRTRDQLCGFQPTRVSGTTTTQQRPNVPNPLDTRVAGLPPRSVPAQTAATVAPVVAAARPAPATARPPATVTAAPNPVRTNLPTSTGNAINPLTGRPVGVAPRTTVQAPRQTASPSPRIIASATPTPGSQPRVLTRTQACEGLTGIQTNLVGQRSGQPIDCGGTAAPRVIAAPSRPAVQAPTQQGLSRAQACADLGASGRQYVSTTTGLPIRCGPQSQRITTAGSGFGQIVTAPTAQQRVVSNPVILAPNLSALRAGRVVNVPNAASHVAPSCGLAVGGLPVRCGPQAQTPSRGASPSGVSTRARSELLTTGILGDLLNQDPPPYSNPSRSLAAPARPSGYTSVWTDGRLNTQRGLPRYNTSAVVAPTTSSRVVRYATAPITPAPVAQPARVQTRVAPQSTNRAEQISGHRYVQVGTFPSRDQAQSIAQNLRSRGLPMRIGVFNQNGREMRIVLAGPFGGESQLQSALRTARSVGYAGAFTRR